MSQLPSWRKIKKRKDGLTARELLEAHSTYGGVSHISPSWLEGLIEKVNNLDNEINERQDHGKR